MSINLETRKYKLPNGVRIPNIEALNDAIADGNESFAIILAGGALRSSKTISRKGSRYYVMNHVDGTVQKLTEKQLLDERYSNVGMAMKIGALIVFDD